MFATLILAITPIVVFMIFRTCRPDLALCICLIGAYLLLPNSALPNIPLMPPLNRNFMPAISCIVVLSFMSASLWKDNTAGRSWIPQSPLVNILLAGLLLGAIGTVLTNGDTIRINTRVLEGQRLYDGLSLILTFGSMLLPFFLGYRFLRSPQTHRSLLLVLCVAALCYSLPTVWEWRMSPQLHIQVYGFFPHDWRQHLRGDGFRPVVFLSHGLELGLFLAMGSIALAGVLRNAQIKRRNMFYLGLPWLIIVIFLSKNLGATFLSMMFLPLALLLPTRAQLIVAASICSIILLYPGLRNVNAVPVGPIMSVAEQISPDRAASLQFRLDNEDRLLEKASQKSLLGWGGWGRARVFDETGRDLSVTDGLWLLVYGEGGWVRYLSMFGLLSLGTIGLALRSAQVKAEPAVGTLALLLTVNMIYLIPNSSLTPISWLIAGALAGRLVFQNVPEDQSAAQDADTSASGRALAYTRFPKQPNTRFPQSDTLPYRRQHTQ
jgi:hypothetical protein